MQPIYRPSLHLIPIVLISFLFGIPTANAAESYYKCKNGKDETTYSEQPCAAKKNQKITVKDNTLDHTELRKSPMYHAKPPQYQAGNNTEESNESGQPAVSSMKKIEGAGFQQNPPSKSDSSAFSPWQ